MYPDLKLPSSLYTNCQISNSGNIQFYCNFTIPVIYSPWTICDYPIVLYSSNSTKFNQKYSVLLHGKIATKLLQGMCHQNLIMKYQVPIYPGNYLYLLIQVRNTLTDQIVDFSIGTYNVTKRRLEMIETKNKIETYKKQNALKEKYLIGFTDNLKVFATGFDVALNSMNFLMNL